MLTTVTQTQAHATRVACFARNFIGHLRVECCHQQRAAWVAFYSAALQLAAHPHLVDARGAQILVDLSSLIVPPVHHEQRPALPALVAQLIVQMAVADLAVGLLADHCIPQAHLPTSGATNTTANFWGPSSNPTSIPQTAGG